MTRLRWLAGATAVIALASLPDRATSQPQEPAPRYPEVQALFEARCAGCHDARKSTNPPAQAVFEMSRGYPFGTQRPATLLEDLRRAVETRFVEDAEKRRAVAWVTAGALDADGRAPVWH